MTDTRNPNPHAELRAMYNAMVAACNDSTKVSRAFEFKSRTATNWQRFSGGGISWIPEYDYRYNPQVDASDVAGQTPAYLQAVIKDLRERNDALNRLARHDSTQITALKAKLEDCAEGRHLAERRLENLQESYGMLQDAKCNKLHEDLTVTAGRLWALQEENERLRADRDDVEHEADRLADHAAALRNQRDALSTKLNFIRDFIERD